MSLKIGERVEIFGNLGTIKFLGTTLFSLERKWVGVSLDNPIGKHDGTIDNHRYFKCEPNHGIFVRPSLVKCISTSDQKLKENDNNEEKEKQKLDQENKKEKEKKQIKQKNKNENEKENDKEQEKEQEKEKKKETPLLQRSLPFVEEIQEDFFLFKHSQVLQKLDEHMSLFSSVLGEKEEFQLEIDELEELINEIDEIDIVEYEEKVNKDLSPQTTQKIENSLKEITNLTEETAKLRNKYEKIKEKIEFETKEQLQKKIDLTQIEIENYKDYIQKEKSKKKKLKQEILSGEMELKVANENSFQMKVGWDKKIQEKAKEIQYEELKIDELLEECERIQQIPFETIKIFPLKISKIKQQNEKLQNEILQFQKGMSLTQINSNQVLTPYDSIDRSQWVNKIMRQHPEIKEIRERVNPKERTFLFSQLYAREKRQVDRQLTKELINTLIVQHFEILQQQKIVETISKLTTNRKIEGQNQVSILRNIFRRAELDTEKIYDLTIRQSNKNGNGNGNEKVDEEENEESISLFQQNSKKMGLRFKIQDDLSIWDEPTDNPNNIKFVKKNNESIEDNILGTLICANINKLIERLTWEKSLDSNYTRAFLMTYPSFMSAEHLLYKLIERYRVVKKKNQDKAEFEKNRIKIRIRVVSVLKQWLRDPAEFNDELLSDIESFIGKEIMAAQPSSAKTLLKLVSKLQLKQSLQLKMEVTQKASPPEPKLPKNIFNSNLKLWDVCAEELARQITIHVSKLFTQIHAFELTTQAWNKPKLKYKAINVLKLIYKFNDLVSYYIEKILDCEGLMERAAIMDKLIQMGDFFLQFNNFDCLIGVVSSVSCSPINRLKFTKDEVSSRSWDIFEDLEEVTSEDHSYRNYRDALAQAENPIIPYIGMYLTDLTFIMDGNQDHINGLINFAKRKMLFLTIDKIQSFQMGCYYTFTEIAQIQKLIDQITPKKTENQYYDMSVLREPRGCERSDLKL
ncbi:ras guanine nucleotide exchange factor i-related [Anaeramoeba flamelloides]|uniref:Ras guanine nucleotide exchange factor i-related n=1 Tax=Anaeramoeba flamelloides TaxID=1746091 RepID=A0ABQ8Z410_9EUKA|nr:ras guanine nucleotide exchange factor i-related [Anaeramoeba flamelloides]